MDRQHAAEVKRVSNPLAWKMESTRMSAFPQNNTLNKTVEVFPRF